jgi:hypothetical protein
MILTNARSPEDVATGNGEVRLHLHYGSVLIKNSDCRLLISTWRVCVPPDAATRLLFEVSPLIPSSRALALAIAQNLLINKLDTSVAQHTDMVPPEYVIAAGVSGLGSLTASPAVLLALRQAYSESVRYTFILAVAALCFAFLPACAMERVNIKQVAEERQRLQKQSKAEEAFTEVTHEVKEGDKTEH